MMLMGFVPMTQALFSLLSVYSHGCIFAVKCAPGKKKQYKITVQKERNGKEIIMFEGQALDKYSQVR